MYLIQSDFKKLIQTDNLTDIIGSDTNLLNSAILTAQSQAKSYLIQKYDITAEMADLNEWDSTLVYLAGARVYVRPAAYDATHRYLIGDFCTYNDAVYICYTAHIGAGTIAFSLNDWRMYNLLFVMYYGAYPQPLFDENKIYKKGDHVFWKNNTYTCNVATLALSHSTQLQYMKYDLIPGTNVFPDDPLLGLQTWGTGTAYSIAANTIPASNPTKWAVGDTRNQQLVMVCLDIALYILHTRIAPRNIPDLRVKRYDDAISWLKDVAKGQYITADLPTIQPSQGNRVQWGSEIKKVNQY